MRLLGRRAWPRATARDRTQAAACRMSAREWFVIKIDSLNYGLCAIGRIEPPVSTFLPPTILIPQSMPGLNQVESVTTIAAAEPLRPGLGSLAHPRRV